MIISRNRSLRLNQNWEPSLEPTVPSIRARQSKLTHRAQFHNFACMNLIIRPKSFSSASPEAGLGRVVFPPNCLRGTNRVRPGVSNSGRNRRLCRTILWLWTNWFVVRLSEENVCSTYPDCVTWRGTHGIHQDNGKSARLHGSRVVGSHWVISWLFASSWKSYRFGLWFWLLLIPRQTRKWWPRLRGRINTTEMI